MKHSLLSRLFCKRQTPVNPLEEEAMQGQLVTILKRLFSKPINTVAAAVFLLFLIGVLVGPLFRPLDVNYQDMTQQNVSPGLNMLDVPAALQGHVKQISVGSTFSLGLSEDGQVYAWGKTQITKKADIADIPENMGVVKLIAAGYDHAVAVNENNEVFCWGNNRLKQCDVPSKAKKANIVSVYAGYQYTAAITDGGEVITWGNKSSVTASFKAAKGQYQKVVFTSSSALALLSDGSVIYCGTDTSAEASVPEDLGTAVDIACTGHTACAVLADGTVRVWGVLEKGLGEVPALSKKAVGVQSGRYHYTVLLEDGSCVSWGLNTYRQCNVPSKAEAVSLYAGYFQNYAVDENGYVTAWGLKGYPLGSDGYGRDVLARLLYGGRMTMTIGCVSVIISTIIGVIVGGVAGYFGGKTDMLLMRFEEIVASLPFLPFAMILSAIIGNKVSETGRILIIMVILGVLSWTGICRLVRAQVLAEREKEYILAGKAMGVKEWKLIIRHIIPNVISVVIVDMTLSFAACMLTESGLSYLGFGVAEPRPTWGNMLSGCNDSVIIQNYWWRWVFPAVALGINTIAINVLGDGMRDAIDPKTEER